MRRGPFQPPRLAARALACAVVACTIAVASAPAASTSGSVVGATVPGATSLDTAGCPSLDPNRTSFGSVVANASVVTSIDCDVDFGSSNATATLRTFRASPRTTAMAAPTTVVNSTQVGGRILGIDMIDATNGWITTADEAGGRIWQTSDGGATWTMNANGNAAFVGGSAEAVSAPTTSVIWATKYANSRIIRSVDGGSTWTQHTLPGTAPRGQDIYAVDGTTAYVSGFDSPGGPNLPRVWKTTTSGASWTTQLSEVDTMSTPQDITFAPGTTRGYVTTSSGEIYRTTDGVNWTQQLVTGSTLSAVSAYDQDHAVVVGSSGQVRVTSNGGTNWSIRDIPDKPDLVAVAYLSTGVVWASGDYGTLYRSDDDGLSWTTISAGPETSFIRELDATSDDDVVIASFGGNVRRTTDAGATWTSSPSISPDPNWTGIDGVDGSNAWRVGTDGAIEHTADGSTWLAQASGSTDGLFSVTALDRDTAVATGTDGLVLRTSDGGSTWNPIAVGTSESLRVSVATPAGHVWVGGDHGTLLRSTNRGASFVPVASGVSRHVTAITALDESTILLATSDGLVRRTTNAGASWSNAASMSSEWVSGLDGIPGTTTVWMTQDGEVGRSTDTAATWTPYWFGSGSRINDIDAVDQQVAWLVGRYGLIRRTTNAGTGWTTVTGYVGTKDPFAVLAMGRDDAITIGDAATTARVAPGAGPPDYGDAGATWAGAAGLFGICLRAAPGTTSTWPTTGSCTTSDGTNWRRLPDHGGATEAATATTTAPGTTTASFRFGMKVPPALAAGSYNADLTFEVVSP